MDTDERIFDVDVLSLEFSQILSGDQKCMIVVKTDEMYETGDHLCIREQDQFSHELTERELYARITHREQLLAMISVYSIEILEGEGI